MAKKNKKSKYTELDKIKLIGILRKTKVEYYDDLYIDTRSNYNIDDLLYALIDIMEKAIRNCENEKYCLNVATALNITTYELLDVNINLNSDYKDKLSNLKKLYVHNCEANKNIPNDELLEIFAIIDHNIISNGIILAGESVDSNLEIESEVVEEEEVSLSIEDVLKDWQPYQKKLEKVVVQLTGKSSAYLIQKDAEKAYPELKKILNVYQKLPQKYYSFYVYLLSLGYIF